MCFLVDYLKKQLIDLTLLVLFLIQYFCDKSQTITHRYHHITLFLIQNPSLSLYFYFSLTRRRVYKYANIFIPLHLHVMYQIYFLQIQSISFIIQSKIQLSTGSLFLKPIHQTPDLEPDQLKFGIKAIHKHILENGNTKLILKIKMIVTFLETLFLILIISHFQMNSNVSIFILRFFQNT